MRKAAGAPNSTPFSGGAFSLKNGEVAFRLQARGLEVTGRQACGVELDTEGSGFPSRITTDPVRPRPIGCSRAIQPAGASNLDARIRQATKIPPIVPWTGIGAVLPVLCPIGPSAARRWLRMTTAACRQSRPATVADFPRRAALSRAVDADRRRDEVSLDEVVRIVI